VINMPDIKTIPTDKLEKDLFESKIDIANCEAAIATGILSYSGGSIKDRLDANRGFVNVITPELERRKNEVSND